MNNFKLKNTHTHKNLLKQGSRQPIDMLTSGDFIYLFLTKKMQSFPSIQNIVVSAFWVKNIKHRCQNKSLRTPYSVLSGAWVACVNLPGLSVPGQYWKKLRASLGPAAFVARVAKLDWYKSRLRPAGWAGSVPPLSAPLRGIWGARRPTLLTSIFGVFY